MVECLLPKEKIASSNLVCCSISHVFDVNYVFVQNNEIMKCQRSLMVKQCFRKAETVGSNPTVGSKLWQAGQHFCKVNVPGLNPGGGSKKLDS